MLTKELMDRVEAGKKAVLGQREFFAANFGRVESKWKEDGSRVTMADVAISEGIFAELRKGFPGDEFFSEEVAPEGGRAVLRERFAWVLDPIDGTNNYALGLPHCAISLGLLEEGRPVFGAVWDFSRKVLMEGGRGMGMRDGGREARVKEGGLGAQSLVGFHSPFQARWRRHAEVLVERFKIRGLGSSTLHVAYVAAGLIDAVVDHNVHVWDIAAAAALLEGAGGELRLMNGESLWPLRAFDLKEERLQFVAGGREACEELEEMLGIGG